MMVYDLALYLGIIISSFYLLIKSADYLISSASVLGQRAGISKFVIGLTLVAIGTSLPELFTALFGIFDAITKNAASAFVFGTVIGSNIANILLVFSVLLLFSKNFKVHVKLFDIGFLSFTTLALTLLVYNGILNYIYSIIFLGLFITYLYMCVKFGSKNEFETEVVEVDDEGFSKWKSNWKLILIFLASLIGLNLAAKGVVYGVENFGLILSIPIEFLTFTTVAFATSLPEIIVTYTSAKKKEFDLAVGNIIGSNISNILFILGIIGLFKEITFNPSTYMISIFVLLFATLAFISMLFLKNVSKSTKYFGIGLFLSYLIYIILMF